MSIASIVAWLWMAAQSGNVSVKINTDGDSVYRVPVMQDARPINPPAPAEHVIEIRTKRVASGRINYCRPVRDGRLENQECGSVSVKIGCPVGAICTLASERVTHEIWIDNVRWGILKESESQR